MVRKGIVLTTAIGPRGDGVVFWATAAGRFYATTISRRGGPTRTLRVGATEDTSYAQVVTVKSAVDAASGIFLAWVVERLVDVGDMPGAYEYTAVNVAFARRAGRFESPQELATFDAEQHGDSAACESVDLAPVSGDSALVTWGQPSGIYSARLGTDGVTNVTTVFSDGGSSTCGGDLAAGCDGGLALAWQHGTDSVMVATAPAGDPVFGAAEVVARARLPGGRGATSPAVVAAFDREIPVVVWLAERTGTGGRESVVRVARG